ncbi:unnamed protein product [Amoebophrya sp. A25]|nr:unnamed protein product [Amoebophrya sp. A25]|eukprot:GSA25T00026088001.1
MQQDLKRLNALRIPMYGGFSPAQGTSSSFDLNDAGIVKNKADADNEEVLNDRLARSLEGMRLFGSSTPFAGSGGAGMEVGLSSSSISGDFSSGMIGAVPVGGTGGKKRNAQTTGAVEEDADVPSSGEQPSFVSRVLRRAIGLPPVSASTSTDAAGKIWQTEEEQHVGLSRRATSDKQRNDDFVEQVLEETQAARRQLRSFPVSDTRRECTSLAEAHQSLLCIPFREEDYENYYGLVGTLCFGTWCVSAGAILLAILMANALQFVYENVYLYLSVLDEGYDIAEAYRKCFAQFFVIFTHVIIFICTLGPFHQAARLRKIEVVLVTFAAAFFLDQVKNALIQPVIWWLVIRRCGRVQPGIQEYNEEYLLQWDLQESLLDEMQRRTREFLEKRQVLMFIIGLVGFYAVFLMLSIVISDCWKPDDGSEQPECSSSLCPGLSDEGRRSLYYAFTYTDFVIMLFFVLEIVLKFFGYGSAFILDPWNGFDSVIVIASFICWFIFLGSAVGTTGLGLLRLLRLVRVMVMISDSRRKLKKVTKSLQTQDTAKSHVERVLDLLERLQNLKIPLQVQHDLEWVVEVILEDKLHKVSVDHEQEHDQDQPGRADNTDGAMTAWIQQLGDGNNNLSGNVATGDGATGDAGGGNVRGTYVAQSQVRGSFAGRGSMANRSRVRGSYTRAGGASYTRVGGSYTRGGSAGGAGMATNVRSMSRARRPSEVNSKHQGGPASAEDIIAQFHTQLYLRSNLSAGEEEQIETSLRSMDEWHCDMWMAAEVCDVNAIPVIFLKFFICYDLIGILNLDFDLLFNFCSFAQERHRPQVPFHGFAHATSMAQAVHYFLQHGLTQGTDYFLTPLHKFTLFFGCMVMYLEYPGLSNEFLVSVRHPRAIRYNDRAVNQNYALALCFANLADPELNFLLHVPKETQELFRRLLIATILKTDLSQHFREVSLFKTKLAASSDGGFGGAAGGNSAGGISGASGGSNNTPAQGIAFEDLALLLSMTLKLADYSWCCRPLQQMLRWSERMHDEFFLQGDVQKEFFPQVSSFCDRDTTDTSKVTLGFILVVAQPLAVAYKQLVRNDAAFQKHVLQEGLEANRAYLQSWVS